MSKYQYFAARQEGGRIFAECRALAFKLTRAQIELFELAYLRQIVQAARGVA